MILQLQPEQIVHVWPGIQEGVEEVGRIVTAKNSYMPNILAALLAGRFQLWIVLNNDRETLGFLITAISMDQLTGETYLMLEMVYGLRKSTEEAVFELWGKLNEYARAYGCDYIKATTNISRAAELLELVGAKEVSRNFIARVN